MSNERANAIIEYGLLKYGEGYKEGHHEGYKEGYHMRQQEAYHAGYVRGMLTGTMIGAVSIMISTLTILFFKPLP